MAKIKFGAGIADARGSVGSVTFSRNTFGAYLREKVTPVNPATPRQQEVRNWLGQLSKDWAELTEAQRIGWYNLAVAFPRTDIFGNPIALTGIAQYQASNIVRRNLPNDPINDPPGDLTVPSILYSSPSIVASTRVLSMPFDPSPLPAETRPYVFSTPAHSAGKTFVKNLLRFAGAGNDEATTPDTITLPATFGPLSAGDTITVLLSIVNVANGVVSPGQRFKITAT